MTRRISMFAVMLSVCLFVNTTACKKSADAPSQASEPNFQEGLNLYFQSHPQCDFFTQPHNATENERDDELANVGVVSKVTYPIGGFFYDFTDAGKAAMPKVVDPNNPYALCYGTKQVVKVVNFTEPSENASKESTVSFTWKLVNVPTWAQSLASKPYWSQQKFGKEVSGGTSNVDGTEEKMMVLTHLGWRVKSHDEN